MRPETATAIEEAAERLAGIVPSKTAAEWIAEHSRIEADVNHPDESSFTDPRREGLSEAWGKQTLSRLLATLANAKRPVPL